MGSTPISPDQQISFTSELFRKGTHLGAMIIPAGYWFSGITKIEMLSIMIPIFFVMFTIDVSRLRRWWFWHKVAAPIGGHMVRKHEEDGDFTGATYILLSVCLTVALFDRPTAVAALAFIIVGDTLAALIGRRWGRHRIWGGKSVEGFLGCLAGTMVVAFFAPVNPLIISVIGAVSAAIIEALPTGIDDNVSVPLGSGLIMTIVSKILSF
jgi:dolichol kinase